MRRPESVSHGGRLILLVLLSAAFLWGLSACASGGAASSGSPGGSSGGTPPAGADRIFVDSDLPADSMHAAIRRALVDQGFSIVREIAERGFLETSNLQVSSNLAFSIQSRVDSAAGGGSRATIQGSYISGMMLERLPDTALAMAPGNVARWARGQGRSVFRMVRKVARSFPHRSISYGPESVR